MNAMTPFGMSLDSFSTQGKQLDLKAHLKNVSELGFEGFEMAAIEDENWVGKVQFEQGLKQYRLDPMCYTLRLSPNLLDTCQQAIATIPEAVLRHFQLARELGLPNVRLQHEWSDNLLKNLLPAAMDNGIWLGMDIDQHQLKDLVARKSSLETIDAVGVKHTGFVLNWITDNPCATKQNGSELTIAHEPLRRMLPYVRILRLDCVNTAPDNHASIQDLLSQFAKHGFSGCLICRQQPG